MRFVFARQVGEVLVVRELRADLVHLRGRIEDLIGVEARDRAADHIAGDFPTGPTGNETNLLEPFEDRRHILNPQPVVLDCLPGCDGAPMEWP